MEIYGEAYARHVKDGMMFEATKAEIAVTLVSILSHYSNAEQTKGVETIYVDSGADAADYRIMQLAQKEDLIVTQDYGLASLALAKSCMVLHHKGYKYKNENIEQLLQKRYLSEMVRKSGKQTKGTKPFKACIMNHIEPAS
ncbi:YaiI/YqxD family protein, partial [Bacillus sp. S2-R3J1-FB-BA1]|uniref:YaiI/YqxD family protein n=1 Tax=Bacillus sp. S2-R3J1-FB-BA1 TaxID=1973490 RepID=UPI000B48E12C